MHGERYTGVPGSAAPIMLPPAPGNEGPIYGLQARHAWPTSSTGPRQVVAECLRAHSLWRVVAKGRSVKLSLTYGTNANLQINDLLSPLVIYVPGQFALYAEPEGINGQTPEVVCSVTPVTNAGIAHARRIVAGGPLALNPAATRYFALTDSVVSIHGGTANGPVPALSSIPLVAGSSLTSGTGYEEFEA